MIGLALGLMACAGGVPETMGDCAALAEPVEREDCRLSLAAAELGDLEALRGLIAQVPSPESRDLLRLRLAVQDPYRAGPLCRDAETDPAAERCRQILGRPHLRTPQPER